MPKGVRRKRKRGESRQGDRARNNRKKVVFTWSAVFLLLALCVMGTAVLIWVVRPKIERNSASHDGEFAQIMQERVVSEFESPTEDAALQMVRQALLIHEISKVEEFFHPGSSSPAEVLDFLVEKEKSEGRFSSLDWLGSMDANGMLLDGVVVNYTTGDLTRNRLAMLTPDAKGNWKIDFDTFARTVKPSWDDLLEKKIDEALVRVIVGRDSYYNGKFRDESQWVCYAMASPDIKEVLLGYCLKSSPQAAAMERMVSNEEMPTDAPSLNRATLEIRRVEDTEARQYEITRVMAEDWVIGPKPFDENFK